MSEERAPYGEDHVDWERRRDLILECRRLKHPIYTQYGENEYTVTCRQCGHSYRVYPKGYDPTR